MKKNVLTFGLISGTLITAFMLTSMYYGSCTDKFDSNTAMVIGFTAMIVAFSFIFVAIKNFRDKYNGGVISFGKAFRIGLFISLIASTMYVIGWLIDFSYFMPDFMDKYSDLMIKQLQAEVKDPVKLKEEIDKMHQNRDLYNSSILFRAAYTYLEILPVGLIISLISALILKKKAKEIQFAA